MQLKATVLKFDPEAKILEFEVEFVPSTELEHEQLAPVVDEVRATMRYERAGKPNPDHLVGKFIFFPAAIPTPSEADLEPDPLKE